MLLVTDQSIWPAEAQQQEAAPPRRTGGALADLAWVLVYFAVAGVLAGFVWWKVATPAYYTRTSDNAVMLQGQLGHGSRATAGSSWSGSWRHSLGGVVLTRLAQRGHLLLVVLAGYAASFAGRDPGAHAGPDARPPGRPGAREERRRRQPVPRLPRRDLPARGGWPGRSGLLIGSVVVIWGTRAAARDVDAVPNRS